MTDLAWQTAPRPSIWAKIDDALLRSDHRGVVFVGAAGVGKTAFARAVASRQARNDRKAEVRWVAATASAAHIPFGAFSHLLDIAPGADSAALLHSARAALCDGVDERRLLIAVDDAQHLDPLSSMLLHQLTFQSQARLVLTVRDHTPSPDAITALWEENLLARIDVAPLEGAETTTLIESVLGGPLETSSAEQLFAISGGNPLFLRHLVDAAVGSGALRASRGVWQLRGATTLPPHLTTLINQRLEKLSPDATSVMQYLAVDEPLALADLTALTSASAVEAAEAAGTAAITRRGSVDVVSPAHPIYTECIRADLGVLTRRRLCADLVGQLAAGDPSHVSDRLRLAALSLDTDTPLAPGALIEAAWEAMRLGDLRLGEVLARGALEGAGQDSLYARLPLAHSLAWQGRGAEADEVLTAVDPSTLSTDDLVAWALPKTANQFWMRGDSAAARTVLAEVRARVGEHAAAGALDALAATFALNAGELTDARATAGDILARPGAGDLAVAWAAATATLAAARAGDLEPVADLAARGLDTAHPGLLRFTIGLGQLTAARLDCDVAGAEALARHYLEFAGMQQPGRAISDVLLAEALMARGSLAQAGALLFQSAAALADTGYSWGPLAQLLLVRTLGQRGDYAQAQLELARAEESHGLRSRIYTPELELARAWTLAAGREMPGAIEAARRAVATARESGQHGVALLAVHDALRLGDKQIGEEADAVCGGVAGELAPLVLRYARHLAARRAAGLDEVAAEFAGHGQLLAAADAAAQAAVLHAGAGRHNPEMASRANAARWSEACANPSTPALERALTPVPLTGRERGIAVLVAEGLSNKAIADRLEVSVRTVEGHIYRACTKLGVADRAALGAAIATKP